MALVTYKKRICLKYTLIFSDEDSRVTQFEEYPIAVWQVNKILTSLSSVLRAESEYIKRGKSNDLEIIISQSFYYKIATARSPIGETLNEPNNLPI